MNLINRQRPHIFGRVSLVEPISFDAMNAELRELLGGRVERLGYLGEFFQLAAHQPDALAAFVRFTESLKDALPWRLVEVVALTIACETGNDYERVQHERLALRLGMSVEELEMLLAGQLACPPFGAEEVACAELARCCARGAGRRCGRRFAALLEQTEPTVAIGVLLLCCRYLAHATFVNTLGIAPPVSSPIAGGRDA